MMIENWKLSRDSVALAQILSFVPSVEQTQVLSKALDGSVYIQTIGSMLKFANVSIFANNEEIKLIDKAAADGALISCVYKDTQYLGYMEDIPDWSTLQAGVWYHSNIKLLIEEEVSL